MGAPQGIRQAGLDIRDSRCPRIAQGVRLLRRLTFPFRGPSVLRRLARLEPLKGNATRRSGGKGGPFNHWGPKFIVILHAISCAAFRAGARTSSFQRMVRPSRAGRCWSSSSPPFCRGCPHNRWTGQRWRFRSRPHRVLALFGAVKNSIAALPAPMWRSTLTVAVVR